MQTKEQLQYLRRCWWKVPLLIGLLLLLPYLWCRTYSVWSSHKSYSLDEEMKKVRQCDRCATQFKSANRLFRPACPVCGSAKTVKHEDLPPRPAPARNASMQHTQSVEELQFKTSRPTP